MPYIGKSPSFGVRNRFVYVASANDTSVSGADANGATLTFTDGAYVDVYLNGVLLKTGTDYNTNTANTIAGLSTLNTNDEVTVVVYDVFSVSDTVSATSGGTFSGGVTVNGAFTSLGIDDNADATAITIDSSEKVGIGTTTPSQLLNLQASTNPVIQVSTLADDNPAEAGALDIVEKQSSASSTATFGQAGVYGFRTMLNGSDNTLRIKSGSQTTVNDRVTLARDTGDLTLSTGNLIIGTSGKGIDFSATSTSGQGSMTSELLDVYEEGTFTPAAGDYSGTMTFTTAYYTKIGRVVNFAFKMTGDGTSDSSQVNITGFPYAVLAEHPVSLSYDVAGNGALQSNTTPTIPNAMVNTAEICYFYIPTGSAFTYSMIGTGYVRVQGTYMTSN